VTEARRILRRRARGQIPFEPTKPMPVRTPTKAPPSPVMTQTTKELILVGIGFLGGLAVMLLALMFEAMHRRGWLLP
jgi:hypothetical protein